ncbi:aminoglycoside phosphotransferase family protein [Halomonas sp. GD1P12]|uniref:aminoglycoside phosphotransferase family protein n=1 Tax=Halomonas sp. GD1P12 TaxID=2982691 RepID=UPI0021E38F3F|nr:phosphotransferase [Halomonas sp. GD1P12]UYF99081.1 phosphotransferase [Halomonas sp. GD1P12]
MSTSRFDALTRWVADQYGLDATALTLAPAGGDASFRRYFRLRLPSGETQIVMDAPPEQEDSAPFVAIGQRLHAANLPVPAIYQADLDQGFLLLEDLGDTPLQTRFIDTASVHEHTAEALALVSALQNAVDPSFLPPFDEALLRRELALFPEWCLKSWLGLEVPTSLAAFEDELTRLALSQPVVSVHRDFDAMNLMPHAGRLYMIDFQDAVAGPITYDVISLLCGRYWRFDASDFDALALAFHARARQDGRLPASVDAAAFLRWCRAMAAQRSLKVLGIFCRLTLRDAKTGYLERLPHFLDHLEDSLAGLSSHDDFARWTRDTLRPAIAAKLEDSP